LLLRDALARELNFHFLLFCLSVFPSYFRGLKRPFPFIRSSMMKLNLVRATLTALVLCIVPTASEAGTVTFGSGANTFKMDFATIGNPGNAADTTGAPNPAGAVAYEYGLGKFEVSEDMINKFNNSQSLQITKNTRGTAKPATSVSWNEAARFVNWLNTSTVNHAAYKFTTGGVNDNIALWTSGEDGCA
jgi:hypothetical protein